jgi:aldehyde:ferredoxin oxidoreductase
MYKEEPMEKQTVKHKSIFGWRGRILRVDLSQSKIWDEELPREYMNKYIGGAGINARLLYDLMRSNPQADALAPENPIIFGCGPMVGTKFPCASRFTVTAKSPLTGIFGDTNAGGFFPVRLKQAGYDHVVIRGRAEKPVALLIEKDKAPRIVDATDTWGLDIYETDRMLQEKYGNCETARIGPAGENLVRYASILSGRKRISSNGRTGMGCLMGSKNLKAIIVKGSGTVPVADEKEVELLAKRYRDIWIKSPGTSLKREYGTLTLLYQIAEQSRVKNEQEQMTPEQLGKYDLEDYKQNYKTGQTACYRCPVACTQKWEISDGTYKGEKGDKVEYGHLFHLGPLLGIFDFPALLHLSDMCNRMGMDCIQFGFNVAIAMECFQRGILSTEQTGGVSLNWGDDRIVEQMMMQAAKREGFGDILAESAPGMISRLGPDAEPYGFHTKGMSFTYSCTFGLPMSLASSVATRGGDHLKGHPFSAIVGHREMLEKIFGKDMPDEIIDHKSPVAKGRVVWWHENYKMIMDSLGICFLPVVNSTVWSDPIILTREMGEMYQTITGRDPSGLFESAERAYQIERCYNTLLGLTRKDDIRKGTMRGEKNPINHPGMLDEYYVYRGCSSDGLPTRKRLHEIGLADVAEDLARNNKLAEQECPDISELLQNSTDVAG